MKTIFTTKPALSLSNVAFALVAGLFCLTTIFASAQVTINNAENFNVGDVLTFVECNTNGVQAGNGGANVTWDFSNLVSTGDTLTEWMVAPTSTSYASQFPTANLVEKYSDGTFVFANKTATQNFLVGYVDSISSINIKYPDPVLFAQRPIAYNDQLNDDFTAQITTTSFSTNGGGSQTVTADGYGTLILPNGTYNNVLRLHFSLVQVDTAVGLGTYTTTHSETYAWFDNAHASALLKIDSSNTSGIYIEKHVSFLHQEVVSNHQPVFNQVNFNASFIGNSIALFGNGLNRELTVEVYNVAGQNCFATTINGNYSLLSPTKPLPAGLYCVALRQNGAIVGLTKVIKAE